MAKRGPSCGVEVLRKSNPDRLKDIDELLENSGTGKQVPYTVAAALLSESFPDYKLHAETLSRHGRGMCACRS